MATFVEFDRAAREEFDEAFDWYAGRTRILSDVVGSEVVLCQMANGVDKHLFPLDRKDGSVRGLAADTEHKLANWEREKLVFADEGVPLGIGHQCVDCGREFVEPAQGLIDVAMLRPPEGISIEI